MKHLSIALMSAAGLLLPVAAGADDSNRTRLTVRNESFTGTNSGEVHRGSGSDAATDLARTVITYRYDEAGNRTERASSAETASGDSAASPNQHSVHETS